MVVLVFFFIFFLVQALFFFSIWGRRDPEQVTGLPQVVLFNWEAMTETKIPDFSCEFEIGLLLFYTT